jgi:hypothetical protein
MASEDFPAPSEGFVMTTLADDCRSFSPHLDPSHLWKP